MSDPDQTELNYEPQSTLSTCGQMRNLSLKSKLVILYVLIFIHLVFIFGDVLLYAVCFITHFFVIFPFFKWWEKYRENCPLDTVIRSFGQGYIVMTWGVGIVNLLIIMPLLTLLALVIPFIGNLTFIAVVGVEELFKVLIARKMKKDMDINRETVANQLTYTAVSIGYATSNAAQVAVFLGMVGQLIFTSLDLTWKTFLLQTCIVLGVLLFTVPMQVLSGYMIGLNTIRQLTFWRVGLEPFLLRTLFTLATFVALIVIPQPWGSFALFGSNVIFLRLMVIRIKKVEGQLPIDYLQRVGYLQAFGYGVLPGEDVDEFEIPPHSSSRMV